jgi:DNA-binding NarL/FixJ family response regulator
MDNIRVLLADDQKLFAESLRTLIETYAEDIEVVGIASDGVEAVQLCEELSPDLILMDVRMPNMDGVEATQKIFEKTTSVRIMVLSTFDEDEYVKTALHYGASGYLLKDISPTELIASIRAIIEGAIQISPSVAEKLVDRIYYKTENHESNLSWYNTLSNREKEIFKLVSKGYGNRQIAEELFIAEQTVRNYVSSMYSKLGVNDRFQIIRLANSLKKNHFDER